ncbi:gamma-glutamyl-gamma-aminobutyrate hydrolase family protein [Marininema halotolerans]|uniref:Putative glutamine amidotransferase n=1 Tax=Marininema halotolerans TaxID=1155944 RepID=A0A1I6SSD4_9BACL|nr:gamma-glutamyl-gamma-aminobutyrate hydrolase family protein [Marininema halotolerans]SFS79871.1 putative glutamine amidotransferase [Marininema halotolerans]
MRPIIGLTISYENEMCTCRRDYSEAILFGGGLPLMIPPTRDKEIHQQLATLLDGLLLTGGKDINPYLFNEEPLPGLGVVEPERDLMEMSLSQEFIRTNKPILAICRGCQLLSVALGGSMYQDLPSQKEKLLQHTQRAPRNHPSHRVKVKGESLLFRITKQRDIRVNSFHHQAVKIIPDRCVISGTSLDGVIEAYEGKNDPFLLALQWHPEAMLKEDVTSQAIFKSFISACRKGV